MANCKYCGKGVGFLSTVHKSCVAQYANNPEFTSKGKAQAERVSMTAKGVNGEVDLLSNRVRIRRKGVMGFLTQGVKGDKDILISQISSIQFKRAGVTNGYIQFAFLGGQEAKGGIFQATKDENTVMFKGGAQQRSFEALKEQIEIIQSEGANAAPPGNHSSLDEIAKLGELKDKGYITQDEFETKKRQLLGP